MWLLMRPMTAAHEGALAGMSAEAVVYSFASLLFSSVPSRGAGAVDDVDRCRVVPLFGLADSFTPAADSLRSLLSTSRFAIMFSFRFPRGGKIRSLKLMLSPEELCGAFTNNDAGSHSVAGGYAGHDGSIGNTQVFNSVDLEVGVYHRHGITSHLGGTRLMPVGND
jgi:hypothetical protein